MPEIDALAKRVKKYRSDLKMSQIDMASEVGISVEEVSMIERGLTDPKLSTMQKIAARMGVTVSNLLDTEFEEGEEQDGRTDLSGV